jgi:hypothetical protein
MPPPVGAPRTSGQDSRSTTTPPRRPGGPGAPRGTGSGGGSRLNRTFIILGVLLAVVAVVVILLIVTSHGSSSSSASRSATQTAASSAGSRAARAAAVKPAGVTVAVLNGTSTSNLAHNVAQQLGGAGYKEGTIATAPDQTQTATVVGYLPGHRAAALLVAKSLKLGSASVQPADQSNRTVACPGSSTCSAQVVVTVGSDLASTP